jgi:hypothetical protein
MKDSTLLAISTLTLAFMFVGYVLMNAQNNYERAVIAATNSICTDEAIERAMYGYGFDVSAADTTEPSMITKIDAYLKK